MSRFANGNATFARVGSWATLPPVRSHCSAWPLLTCGLGGLTSRFRSLIAGQWDPTRSVYSLVIRTSMEPLRSHFERGFVYLARRPATCARRRGPIAYSVNRTKLTCGLVVLPLINPPKHKHSHPVKHSYPVQVPKKDIVDLNVM